MTSSSASIRLITYSNEFVNRKTIYVCSNCVPIKSSRFEPAGHSFHDIALKLRGSYKKENVPDDDDDDDGKFPKEKKHDYTQSSDSYSSKGTKKKSKNRVIRQDHYALLGLGDLRCIATVEQIRKSYHQTALKHHPDKQAALLLRIENEAAKQVKKDEIEERFKAIQEAYEVLMDPVRRRIYDSTDDQFFDDEIPTSCTPQDFFMVFGPVFMRNGRWSVIQPVPLLGDDNTPLKDVDAFYDFWFGFKSWREFEYSDDDFTRCLERLDEKFKEKARKAEHLRIRSLVENAYKRDPRIIKIKEMLKAEKQKKKEAKYMAKKLEEEEAARIAEENKRKKEEEDKAATEAALNQRKLKEKEKKLLRKERTRLRTLSNMLDISQDDVENICMSLDILQLRNLCDSMEKKEGDSQSQGELLKEAISFDRIEKERVANGQQNESVKVKVKVNGIDLNSKYEIKERPWGKEEIELLRKGILKYPKGTFRRWEVVSEYIGTKRSVEEILKATKTVLLQKPDSAKAFDSFLEKRKKSTVPISSPLTTREEVVGVDFTSTPTQPNVVQAQTKVVRPEVDTVDPIGSSLDQDVWTDVQVKALIQGLKTFSKETNQRWERVAAAVPGKTVNQCKKKFVLLKENFRREKK